MESKCLYTTRKNYYSSTELNSKFEPKIKLFCLQQLYEAAFKNLKETQRDGSLSNICKVMDIKIPFMLIIGDIQGEDFICGKG